MNPRSTIDRRSLLAGAACMLALPGAWAQAQKPLRLVAAGPAGATADAIARLLAEELGKVLGRRVIVDPRAGGAGMIAVNELLAAPADGSTLLVGVNSLVSEIPHIVKVNRDMFREITPMAELARGGLVLVGNPEVPAGNLKELVAYARQRPGQINYASYSAGTLSHVLGLLLNEAAGIQLVHVPYKGSTAAMTDVVAGHTQLMFDAMTTALPMIRGGRVKAYAISTPERSPLLPDVPTFAELGYSSLTATGWMGLWCSGAMPADVQQPLLAAVRTAMASPSFGERLRTLGFDLGRSRTSGELSKDLHADHERVGRVLKAIGFKPE